MLSSPLPALGRGCPSLSPALGSQISLQLRLNRTHMCEHWLWLLPRQGDRSSSGGGCRAQPSTSSLLGLTPTRFCALGAKGRPWLCPSMWFCSVRYKGPGE